MTLDDFLAKLRLLTVDWWLDEIGRIRCYQDVSDKPYTQRICCPLTALGTVQWMYQYLRVAEELGLNSSLALDIAHCADNKPSIHKGLRERLLAATIDRKTPHTYERDLRDIDTVRTIADVRAYVQRWGGVLAFEHSGTVVSPWGKVIEVGVSR